jgi:heat shock protein HslJ
MNLKENEKILLINSLRITCKGLAAQQCLQVKEDGDSSWTAFFSEINGFDYEEGYIYRVLVSEKKLASSEILADGSSIRYTLVEQLEKQRDPKLRLNDIWVLETMEKEPVSTGELQQRPRLEIHLTEQKVIGTDGCNNFTGNLKKLDSTMISFGPLAGTRKMCPDMTIANKMNRLMPEVRYYRLDEGTLYLLDADKKELFAFHKTD